MKYDIRGEVDKFRAMVLLGLLSPVEAVRWAVARLADGEDHPALVGLAGEVGASVSEIEPYLSDLAAALGLPDLTEAEAGMIVARAIAASLGRGAAPIDVAREIWHLAREVPSAEPALRAFIGLASEWEDDVANREFYDAQIRARATELATGRA